MTKNHRWSVLPIALGIVLFTLSALAQPQNAGESAGLRQFEEGVKLYETGQFERALIAFQGSLQLLASPNTRLYVARCYRALGKTASAYVNYKRSAREAIDRLQATGEKRYSATRDAATAELGEIEPKVPRLTVAVPSNTPPDFKLTLDGADLPRGAWGTAIEVDPGRHEVRAQAERHVVFQRSIDAKEGEQLRIQVTLERIPTAYLTLVFASRPSGLAVSLDGKPLDSSAPLVAREVDVGEHVLRAEAPGYVPFSWKGTLRDGAREKVQVKLDFAPRGRDAARGTPPWLLYTALGVTAVGFGAGTYFALSARSASDREQERDPLLRSEAEQDGVKRDALFADIGFLVGTMGAISSGVLLFTTQWNDGTQRTPRASPVIGPGFAGAAASGRF
jgi:hypothetical protein